MSTKCTLSYNFPHVPEDNDKVPAENRDPNCPQYHLYEECFEEDRSVWLDIENIEFKATPDNIVIKIPVSVWNRIIKIGER